MTEESASIECQIAAARKYAARGWEVVLVKHEDEVSASKAKPEARVGWRASMYGAERFDVVII